MDCRLSIAVAIMSLALSCSGMAQENGTIGNYVSQTYFPHTHFETGVPNDEAGCLMDAFYLPNEREVEESLGFGIDPVYVEMCGLDTIVYEQILRPYEDVCYIDTDPAECEFRLNHSAVAGSMHVGNDEVPFLIGQKDGQEGIYLFRAENRGFYSVNIVAFYHLAEWKAEWLRHGQRCTAMVVADIG